MFPWGLLFGPSPEALVLRAEIAQYEELAERYLAESDTAAPKDKQLRETIALLLLRLASELRALANRGILE
jgi:hypothetical protein